MCAGSRGEFAAGRGARYRSDKGADVSHGGGTQGGKMEGFEKSWKGMTHTEHTSSFSRSAKPGLASCAMSRNNVDSDGPRVNRGTKERPIVERGKAADCRVEPDLIFVTHSINY